MPRSLFTSSTLAILALGIASGCTAPVSTSENDQLLVVATTGPVGDLLRNIVGEQANVETLMGPGVDPHLYRELPSDTEKLGAADVIFYNGLHLEGRMGDTLQRLGKRKPVFAVTQGLVDSNDPRLMSPPDFAGHHDPHVWHDVAMWSECAQYVADRMAEVDEANADAYQAAATKYIAQLRELDQECRDAIQKIPAERRVLITAHDAFAYFSKAYGLEAVGLKGISTEEEIDLGHMDDVVQLIVSRQVPCVFVESAVAPQIMQALAEPCRAQGHDVFVPREESQQLYADALGKLGSGADTYIGMIRANVGAISDGLTGRLGKPAGEP